MKDPIRPCVQEKCPNKKQRTQGLIYRTRGNWLRKPDVVGIAFCECCNKTIKYGSSGKKAVKKHSDNPNHQKNMKTIILNEVEIQKIYC